MIDEGRIKYGDLFFKRAIEELPEMESSKAAAKIVSNYISENDKILDVGCGSGHYLVSISKVVNEIFSYEGIDKREYNILKANEAIGTIQNKYPQCHSAKFSTGDIFNLPFDDNYASIVMCNNVLLHLPSIEKPINELLRVSKKYVFIRMLLGKKSFRIKQIEEPEKYDENGEPLNFHFYNIYSEDYIKSIVENNANVNDYKILEDNDFDPSVFGTKSNYVGTKPDDLTSSIDDMQVNVYIIQPWQFVIIEKNS